MPVDEDFELDPDHLLRDRPLSGHWTTRNTDSIRSLGVVAKTDVQFQAINSVLTEAVLAADERHSMNYSGRVSYSRNRNFYIDRKRYNGPAYTFNTVLPAVEQAVRLGLVEEDRAEKGNLGWQSSFCATPMLIEALGDVQRDYNMHEIIRLKGSLIDKKDKRLVGYDDTRATVQMRRELHEINEYLRALSIDLSGQDITRTSRHLIVDGIYYRPDEAGLFRVFNRGSFDMGGRAYGWWQTLRKPRRLEIILDGEAVSEPDFHQFHVSLLYAERGHRLEEDTAYDVAGFTRSQAKLAFNVAFNTATRAGTIGALTKKRDWELSAADTGRLLDELALRHPLIADALNNDRGIRLQRLDSEITIGALKACMKEGIAALPVHDSMITAKRNAGRVAELMAASAAKRFKVVNPCVIRISS